MLSIIISSYQPDFFNALENNIAETCGIPYEIIKIENPGIMGISEAYNKGAEKARFENLLFLHEDVLFDTKNWGQTLISLLEDKNTGCVGLAGSSYVPNVPHKWWKNEGYCANNVVLYQNKIKTPSHCQSKSLYKSHSIDGVFMACRREVYSEFLFNSKLTAYHGYDIDFSIRVGEKYNNYILNGITLLHYSGGNANKEWFKEIIKARKNYKVPKNQITDQKVEETQYIFFGEYLYRFYTSKLDAILLLFKYFDLQRLGLKNVILLIKFSFYILRR